ncbi:MAG: hypothetical protein WBZ31_11370 [Thiobacillus sp.]
MLSRRMLPWLFALTLLFGQAAAYAHTLGHLKDRNPGSPAHPCEQCMAQADLEGAAASTPPLLHLPAATFAWFVAAIHPALAPRLPVPRARAPPVSL